MVSFGGIVPALLSRARPVVDSPRNTNGERRDEVRDFSAGFVIFSILHDSTCTDSQNVY
jgi:hypothetical protein